MTFHLITLFPRAFDSYLGESILKRAIEDKKIKVKFYNPRDFTRNKHLRIDRAPYGGGPGMVIQALPVIRATQKAYSYIHRNVGMRKSGRLRIKDKRLRIVWLTPSGKQFTNDAGRRLAQTSTDIIIICGRYEGIDARVKQAVSAMRAFDSSHYPVPPKASGYPSLVSLKLRRSGSGRRGGMPRIEELSVGPFVLTGGELPAMILIDVIARQVEGVLGDPKSREETRTASPEVYTRPKVFKYKGKQYRVPKVLLTGHHKNIDAWRNKRKR